MAELGLDFNHEEVEPSQFDALPAGTYIAEVTESDVVVPNGGRGKMVKLTLDVTEGEYAGRKIFDNLFIQHENSDAQRIGQQRLAALCASCGIRGPLHETEALHGIPVSVLLRVRKSEQYGEQNTVRDYKPRDGSNTVHPVKAAPKDSGGAASPSPQPGTKKPLAWQKPKQVAETAA